jgi:hypothetical protein
MGNSAAFCGPHLFFTYLPRMKLSPFLYADDPARKGTVLIFGTTEPFPVGQVWRFKTAAEMDTWLRNKPADQGYVAIEGYYVLVTLVGRLDGDPNWTIWFKPTDCKAALQQMADFLLQTRIMPDKSYWKRYARQSDGS